MIFSDKIRRKFGKKKTVNCQISVKEVKSHTPEKNTKQSNKNSGNYREQYVNQDPADYRLQYVNEDPADYRVQYVNEDPANNREQYINEDLSNYRVQYANEDSADYREQYVNHSSENVIHESLLEDSFLLDSFSLDVSTPAMTRTTFLANSSITVLPSEEVSMNLSFGHASAGSKPAGSILVRAYVKQEEKKETNSLK